MTQSVRRILVATDLSEASRVALQRAGQLARQHQAVVELIYVARSTAVLPEWLAQAQPRLADTEALSADLRGRLTAMAVEAGLDGGLELAVEVRFGKVAQVLANRAAETGAELLVVGAHGETGFIESVVGTTAQKIVRIADVPVLVVRRPADRPYRKVLVSTDFSAAAAGAAEFAQRLAPHASFEVFHAYDVPYFTLMTHAGVSDGAMGDYRALALEDAQAEMRTHLEALGSPFDKAKVVFRHGYAPPLVGQHVAEHGTDLVVVGAQGRSAIGATLLGSVSSRVLAESPCDVLVTRGSDRR